MGAARIPVRIGQLFDSSLDGLDRFESHDGVAAGLHIFDSISDEWNVPAVESRFNNERVVLVEWAKRERGIIVRPGLTDSIKSLSDLAGKCGGAEAARGRQSGFI